MTEAAAKPKILLIDDEVNILRAIRRVLIHDGYVVEIAEGGAEGIRKLQESDYAVVICDQRMPDVNGAEVLSESCKLRPDTYRITLTGYTDLASAQRSINEGNIHRFLTKPWDENNLREVVRQGVEAYNLIVENRRLSVLAEERRIELEQWNQELEEKVAARTRDVEIRNKALIRLRDQAEESLHDTVSLLVSLLDAAHPDAAAHCRRVGELSAQIGKQLELDSNELRTIAYTALLHEIGRLAELHDKKGAGARSKPKEKRSPLHEVSHAMLSQVRGFKKVAEAILYVPAPFGGGARFQEKGDRIPVASRVIAAADVYDLAAVDLAKGGEPRPDAGRKAVRAGSGTRLDPQIVAILDSDGEQAPALPAYEVELSPVRLRVGMCLSRDLSSTLDMLLLKKGTVLDEALIGRIKHLAAEQMLPRGIFVRCEQDTEEGSQGQGNEPETAGEISPPDPPDQEVA